MIHWCFFRCHYCCFTHLPLSSFFTSLSLPEGVPLFSISSMHFRDNANQVMVPNLFDVCLFESILQSIFESMFIRDIGLQLYFVVSIWFRYQNGTGFVEGAGDYFFCFYFLFLKSLRKIGYRSFLNVQSSSTMNPSDPGLFMTRRIFITIFNLLTHCGSVQAVDFFLSLILLVWLPLDNHSYLLYFSNLMNCKFLKYYLIVFWISLVPAVMFTYSFFILFICVFFFPLDQLSQ